MSTHDSVKGWGGDGKETTRIVRLHLSTHLFLPVIRIFRHLRILPPRPRVGPPTIALDKGTWEERDVTPWAKETLSASLLCASYVLPDGSPSPGSRGSIIEVSKIDGNASHAAVRGKKKYIYEFSITVKWELELSSPVGGGETTITRCRGEMTFPDVDGTVESGEGYDVSNYAVDGTTCSLGIRPLLERFVRDGGLRDSLHGAIDDWVALFRATY